MVATFLIRHGTVYAQLGPEMTVFEAEEGWMLYVAAGEKNAAIKATKRGMVAFAISRQHLRIEEFPN
jgi:5-deoxy-D-glucuronate isomerase